MHFEGRLRRVFFGAVRATVKLGKKLHLKLQQTVEEPQLSLFLKLFQNSPTSGRAQQSAEGPRISYENEKKIVTAGA